MTAPPARPRVLGVVVPVHDEQALLDDCLTALRTSARNVAGRARVVAVAVLDDCRDRSEIVARRHRVGIVRLRARNVGRARRAGCAALLGRGEAGVSWLASTDADSQVPENWFAAHLDALDAGWDALAGTIHVGDWSDHPPSTEHWFQHVYDGSRGLEHPHVHGANLGVRATSYRAVGGFAPETTGEDVSLVDRLDRAGFHVHRTRAVPVLTSARRSGRAPRGFAAYLLRAPEAALAQPGPGRVVTSAPATERAGGGTRVRTSSRKSASR